jgi:tetratricopeptide (TPR) repeat protein
MRLDHPSVLRALDLHRASQFDAAVDAYRAILRSWPKLAGVWSYLAQALEARGDEAAAITAVHQALKIEPANVYLHQQLAQLLNSAGRVDEAITLWQQFAIASKGSRPSRLGLAGQLALARRAEAARRELQSWLETQPTDLEARYELGRLSERLGDTAQARACLEAVQTAMPDHIETGILLAKLDARAGRLAEARAALERLSQLPAARTRGDVLCELALVLDKLGHTSEAFKAAELGQSRTFAALEPARRDGSLHERVIAAMLEITPEDVQSWPRPTRAELGTSAPIFLVGFPRSGTTLIEQMLSAHPRLVVSDEAPLLQRVRQSLFQQFKPTGDYPRDLGLFTQNQIDKARGWYLDRAERVLHLAAKSSLPGETRRIIDKQPLNTIDLAVVRLLFPEAPVMYIQRDPRDTVLSVFLQGFARGVPHLFSLEATARLYALFAQTFEHFQRVLGLRTLVVRYEDLVRTPEHEARRMLEFIDEPWTDAVLNAHAPEHRRFVTTPTYADVSTPIHSGGIGRWNRYAEQLKPVMPVLEPWVKAWGYS